jgi:hypothetical protein
MKRASETICFPLTSGSTEAQAEAREERALERTLCFGVISHINHKGSGKSCGRLLSNCVGRFPSQWTLSSLFCCGTWPADRHMQGYKERHPFYS